MNKKGKVALTLCIALVCKGALFGVGYFAYTQYKAQPQTGVTKNTNNESLVLATWEKYNDGNDLYPIKLKLKITSSEEDKVLNISTEDMNVIAGQNPDYRFINVTEYLQKNFFNEGNTLNQWLEDDLNSLSVCIETKTHDNDCFFSSYYKIETGGLYFVNLPVDLGGIPEIVKGELIDYVIVN